MEMNDPRVAVSTATRSHSAFRGISRLDVIVQTMNISIVGHGGDALASKTQVHRATRS
jgi:hypothetical protein